jgi:N-ethylmaleimide reductase
MTAAKMDLAYVHVIEGATGGARQDVPFDFSQLRDRFITANKRGAWMVNNGYDRAMAMEAVASESADLVAFGRAFISNPDLVERLRHDLPLAPLDAKTLYGGDAAGYTDYLSADAAMEVD